MIHMTALGLLQYEDVEALLGMGVLMVLVGIMFLMVVIVPLLIWSIRSRLGELNGTVERIEALMRAAAAKGSRPPDTGGA